MSFSRSVSSCNQLKCFCQIISSSSQLPYVVLSFSADVFLDVFASDGMMTVRVFAKCPSLISSIIKIDYDSSIMVDRESELLAQIVTEQEKV